MSQLAVELATIIAIIMPFASDAERDILFGDPEAPTFEQTVPLVTARAKGALSWWVDTRQSGWDEANKALRALNHAPADGRDAVARLRRWSS